jgi:hypothetical protein
MQCIQNNKDTLQNKYNCYNLDKLQDCFYCSLLENVATNVAGGPSLCEWPNLAGGKESCLGMNIGAKCCKWTPQPTPPIYPPTTSYSAVFGWMLLGFVVSGIIVLIIWLIVRKKSKRSHKRKY